MSAAGTYCAKCGRQTGANDQCLGCGKQTWDCYCQKTLKLRQVEATEDIAKALNSGLRVWLQR